ncbi:MAG TPA: hypothetical protein HA277_01895, partial [Methanosphaera sp.]|nr:hypothetical protein [Methanosphaera sp.]
MINNRTKMFLLFTLIFIAMIGISAATAADTDNNATDTPVIAETPTIDVVDDVQTTDVDNKVEITKNTQTNVKTATFGYLNDLANDINGSSEVTLTRDYSGKAGMKYIQLNNSITIDGAGHTISNLTQGLFEITSGNTLTVKNLKLTGGKTIVYHVFQVKGTLICENVTVDFKDLPANSKRKSIINLMNNNTNVTLKDCTIKNYASWGSVYSTDSCSGTLLMDNCTIQNNTPGSYGLIIIDAPGSNATIKNSKFIKNIGISQYGGAIGVKNSQNIVLIENCLFEGNAAKYFGGAIFVRGNVTVKNSVFKDNLNTNKPGSTSNATIQVSGGLLYAEGNTMDDLTPVEIYVSSGNVSSPILKGVDVYANPNEEVNITYTLTDDMGNSIIYSMGSYSMTIGYRTRFVKSSDVQANNGTITATFPVPEIEARYPVSIDFKGVETIEGHDIIIINPTLVVGNVGYDLNLTDETWDQFFNEDGTPKKDVVGEYDILKFNGKFTNRHMNINIPLTITTGETQAVLDGCTINVNSEINIKNITATNTYVKVSDDKKLNLTNSSFADTNTNMSIINVGKNTVVNVEKSNFTNICAEGVFTIDSDSLVQIKESQFKNCTSNVQGGAIITKENSNVTFDECIFTNNSAGLRGGAICSYGNLTVKNSDFVGNKVLSTTFAKDQGGAAIYVEGDVWLYNNYMNKNSGLTGDIYNGGAVIHTPIRIVFEDVEVKQGSKVVLLAAITDDDGDTVDLYADMKDGEYYLNHNLTVDNVKYDLTRNQTLKGMINRPINNSLAPGNYTVSIEVDTNEIPDAKIYPGKLEIIPTPRPNVNLTDETWNQFFNEDGTLKVGIVKEGEELQFHGTFTNRQMNITTPITITTGETQAVFDGCTFTISSPTTIKNVQFTGTTPSHSITANANLT